MPNPYFHFKQFTIHQDRCAMKVTTDACLFGAWVSNEMQSSALKVAQVADVGSGTGLLSLMVAQKNRCTIDAIEINKDAAEQAGENIKASPWKHINLVNTDVTKWQALKKFDVIISNPPFYENELRSNNDAKNAAHHDGGLKLSVLFLLIKQNLEQKGKFFLLLPFKRHTESLKLLLANSLFINSLVFVKQSVSHQPFRLMIKGGCSSKQAPEEHFISIKNADGNYTTQFIALLKDYYLHL